MLHTDTGAILAGIINEQGMTETIASYYLRHGANGIQGVHLIGIRETSARQRNPALLPDCVAARRHPATSFQYTSFNASSPTPIITAPPMRSEMCGLDRVGYCRKETDEVVESRQVVGTFRDRVQARPAVAEALRQALDVQAPLVEDADGVHVTVHTTGQVGDARGLLLEYGAYSASVRERGPG